MPLSRVTEFCRRLLAETGSREIWVACSGGLDSVALLDLVLEFSRRGPDRVRVGALHFNHNLRPAAREDELLVAGLARQARIPLRIGRAWGLGGWVTKPPHLSLENAARNARYAFFHRLLAGRPAAVIVTAHQAEDQAETLLLNLMRGSGLKGLKGIPRRRGRIGRPLLEVGRTELASWVQCRGLPYREDESNRSSAFLRNRVRQELLPVLRSLGGPAVITRIGAAGLRLASDWEFIEEQLDRYWEEVVGGAGRIALAQAVWQRLPPALKPHFLGRMLRRVETKNLVSARVLEELCRLADSGLPRGYDLGAGFRFRSGPEEVEIARRDPAAARVATADFRLEISSPGEYELPGGRGLFSLFPVSEGEDETGLTRSPFIETVAGNRLLFPLVLRGRRPGERFQPLGLGGRSRKLKKYFNELRLTPRQRACWPLLVNGNGAIIWILGRRLDHRFRLTPDCRQPIRLHFTPGAELVTSEDGSFERKEKRRRRPEAEEE